MVDCWVELNDFLLSCLIEFNESITCPLNSLMKFGSFIIYEFSSKIFLSWASEIDFVLGNHVEISPEIINNIVKIQKLPLEKSRSDCGFVNFDLLPSIEYHLGVSDKVLNELLGDEKLSSMLTEIGNEVATFGIRVF